MRLVSFHASRARCCGLDFSHASAMLSGKHSTGDRSDASRRQER
jgi:hypothetical protein